VYVYVYVYVREREREGERWGERVCVCCVVVVWLQAVGEERRLGLCGDFKFALGDGD
jgi:hypothetical protein